MCKGLVSFYGFQILSYGVNQAAKDAAIKIGAQNITARIFDFCWENSVPFFLQGYFDGRILAADTQRNPCLMPKVLGTTFADLAGVCQMAYTPWEKNPNEPIVNCTNPIFLKHFKTLSDGVCKATSAISLLISRRVYDAFLDYALAQSAAEAQSPPQGDDAGGSGGQIPADQGQAAQLFAPQPAPAIPGQADLAATSQVAPLDPDAVAVPQSPLVAQAVAGTPAQLEPAAPQLVHFDPLDGLSMAMQPEPDAPGTQVGAPGNAVAVDSAETPSPQ
jgi:hypothetical protein